MQTVFVATDGEYSDFHIVGIYSTAEEAEKHSIHIQEWNVDGSRVFKTAPRTPTEDTTGWIERVSYGCRIDIDGNLLRTFQYGPKLSDPTLRGAGERITASMGVVWAFEGRSYVSEYHAWKLAVEARQAYLREQGVNGDAG